MIDKLNVKDTIFDIDMYTEVTAVDSYADVCS